MTSSKRPQNSSEAMSELFVLLAQEFGPVLAHAGAKFVDNAVNRPARENSTTESATDSTAGSSDAGSVKVDEESGKPHTPKNNGSSSQAQEQTEHDDANTEAENEDTDELKDTAEPNQTEDAYADDAYRDADEFVQQSQHRIDGVAVAAVLNSGDVVGVIKDLITQAGEVRKFEEVQITQRAEIAASRDIAIANIEAQKQALQLYLEKSFDERRTNFDKLFAVVDHSLETGNMQELAQGLQSILTLADSSPFKDLESVEATATALADPDHEWDF